MLDSIKISLYRVVRDSSFEISKAGLDYMQQPEASDLVKSSAVKELCRDSDAVNIVADGLSIFTHYKKSPPSSIQLLTVPSVVRSLQILKAPDGNGVHDDLGEYQQGEDVLKAFGISLKPEEIQLDANLIAYDSSVDGILSHDFLALKVVGDGVERVILRGELLASANRAGSHASSTTATKTRRGGKVRKTRKRKRAGGGKRRNRNVKSSKTRKRRRKSRKRRK